jgi:hypothetical protein
MFKHGERIGSESKCSTALNNENHFNAAAIAQKLKNTFRNCTPRSRSMHSTSLEKLPKDSGLLLPGHPAAFLYEEHALKKALLRAARQQTCRK